VQSEAEKIAVERAGWSRRDCTQKHSVVRQELRGRIQQLFLAKIAELGVPFGLAEYYLP